MGGLKVRVRIDQVDGVLAVVDRHGRQEAQEQLYESLRLATCELFQVFSATGAVERLENGLSQLSRASVRRAFRPAGTGAVSGNEPAALVVRTVCSRLSIGIQGLFLGYPPCISR